MRPNIHSESSHQYSEMGIFIEINKRIIVFKFQHGLSNKLIFVSNSMLKFYNIDT